jgi:hypothetical protein
MILAYVTGFKFKTRASNYFGADVEVCKEKNSCRDNQGEGTASKASG